MLSAPPHAVNDTPCPGSVAALGCDRTCTCRNLQMPPIPAIIFTTINTGSRPDRHMRILHLNTERTWRGGEQQMCSLVLGLQKLGHQCVILCRPDAPCIQRARAMSLNALPWRTRGDLDFLAARKLARIADETAADIIHAHTARTLIPAASCRFFTRRPLCTVAHRRVDFSIHKLPLRLSGLKYRWGIDRFIAITRAVRDIMIADGIPARKISVVYSSADLSRFPSVRRDPALRAELGVPDNAPLIGNVAALVGHKGQKYFVAAAAEVLKRHPRARFVIFGEGPLRAELEAQVRSLGLGDRFLMPGFRENILAAILELDLFCMSSSAEGMGSVVLEALALERPVVVTTAGGLPEIIQDRHNGLLVPPRDPQSLADALSQLLEDPPLAHRLAAAGKETVTAGFAAEKMTADTLAVYSELLAARC